MVHKSSCLDVLESFFSSQLATATYYVKLLKGNQLAVWYTSVIIALGTIISILIYHIFQQLITKVHKTLEEGEPANQELFVKLKSPTPKAEHDLINDPTESVNLDQLHEPCLENLLATAHP